MFNYFNSLIDNMKIQYYKLANPKKTNSKYISYDNMVMKHHKLDKKIVLMYIKQLKNIYYKYTDNKLYNERLYHLYAEKDDFDNDDTAYDDDEDIKIFDKYVIEYIKNRNQIVTYMMYKNKKINIKTSLEDLQDIKKSENSMDILFTIDMKDNDILSYYFENEKDVKAIVFSMIFKFNNSYVNIEIHSPTKVHPLLMVETMYNKN